MSTSLHKYFSKLPDPRSNKNQKHSFTDIVVLTVIAVICGAESWDDIELFGKSKEDFLSKILYLPNGIPSHDTINRVVSSIREDKFEQVFIEWSNSLRDNKIKNDVISIDGKTVRRSKDTYHNKKPVHIVNVWSNENQLVLGQLKVDEKSNEITAIPKLLEILDIEDSIITIDAMGTQKEIAKKIIKEKADYILALKGNHSLLEEEAESIFKVQKIDSSDEDLDKGHGRIEIRNCEVITDLEFLQGKEQWEGISSIIRITSTRIIRDKTSIESRLYISSLNSNAKDFNRYIRQHWGVENSLHYTLDVTFNEDQQRKRNNNAAQNFSIIQKIALNLLKKEKSKKISIKAKRLKAAWDNDFLIKVLGI